MELMQGRTPADIVEGHFKELEAKNFERARMFLADDFRYSGPGPRPMTPREYIEMHRALMAGMPDLKYNVRIIGQQSNKIQAAVRITGTHTGDVKLAFLGEEGTLKATGRSISLAEEKVAAQVKDERIVQLRMDSSPHRGVLGVLRQLGVHLKKAG